MPTVNIKYLALLAPFFCFLFNTMFAQTPDYLLKENSIWVFGGEPIAFYGDTAKGINLDFNTGGAPVVTSATIAGFGEAAASVCDTNGVLLFYTDGTYVFDAHGQLMPHGDSLVADKTLYKFEDPAFPGNLSYNPTSSTTQGALIVPVINEPGKYYIFSLTSLEHYADFGFYPVSIGHAGELFYSVVDMSLNNGLGDIVVARRGVLLDSNLSEGMAAVAGTHCDVWVLVHSYGPLFIKAYNVTASGVNTSPVVSSGSAKNAYKTGSSIKVSSDRRMLSMCSGDGGVELCGFDPSTGNVLSLQPIVIGLSSDAQPYQSCFSPDNSKLYINCGGTAGYIEQVDLNDPTLNTKYKISDYYYSDMQLGPDGKIYLLKQDDTSINSSAISCISNPNMSGSACGFIDVAITIDSGFHARFGLHNMFVKPAFGASFANHSANPICGPASDNVILTAPAGFNTYLWSTGSTDASIYAYTVGTYILKSINSCDVQYDTFHVKKVTFPLSLGPDSTYCANAVTLYAPVAKVGYLWQDGSMADSLTVRHSGIYSIRITDSGCTYRDTVAISFYNVQQDLGNDTSICDNDRVVQLTLAANVPPGATVTWSNGDNTPKVVAGPGTWWVTVNDDGCIGTDTITIASQLCQCRPYIPNAFSPNGDGRNDVFRALFETGCPINYYVLRVYNRWGNLVFSATDPQKGWDGTVQHTASDAGDYWYEIRFLLGSDKQVYLFKGDVTLIR